MYVVNVQRGILDVILLKKASAQIFNNPSVKKLEPRFCKEYYLRYRVTFNVADNLILNLYGCYFRQANQLEAESILTFISCPRKTQKCLQAAALSE